MASVVQALAQRVAPGPQSDGVVVRVAARPTLRHVLNATVVVAALGYFVDVYDLLLFSILRVPSLQGLGVPRAQQLPVGVVLLNAQMGGLLLGGIAWGVLGDKRGRVRVLFGSILLYSLANLANAFVQDPTQYAALRFVAGLGLAGELGAGVTLVTEVMPRETRGWGTAVVSGFGILGAVVAALVGGLLPWRAAFVVGGAMGLALLVARLRLRDSAMFRKAEAAPRGDVTRLFRSGRALRRFVACVLVGVPLWFVVGVLFTFAPELGRELGVTGPLSAGLAVAIGYTGATLGSLASGALSERLRSRRKALGAFLAATTVLTMAALLARGEPPGAFYALCFVLGLGVGYWAVFMVASAEQFGTNLRATVTTSVPNLVRGAVVPLTLAVTALRAGLGLAGASIAVGLATFALAAVAIALLPETYGRELDFVEA